MPELLEEREISLEWSDIHSRVIKRRPPGVEHRSSGVHLSGVIRYCLVAVGGLTVHEVDSEVFPLRMAVGMAWEDFVVGFWPGLKWQPGECHLDEVFGSPDGRTGNVVEEFKATWKSRHTYGDVINQPLWMWQLAGYLKMLGLTEARMHILWLNGDYRPPSPVYVTYSIRFTQQEIDQFWNNVVLKNKDRAPREEH